MSFSQRQHSPERPRLLSILAATLIGAARVFAGAIWLEQGFRDVPDTAKLGILVVVEK